MTKFIRTNLWESLKFAWKYFKDNPFITYTARGSVKTSVWMCIIRSPPAVYSITKHTCSGVWKHANRLIRKGWCDMLTISKMRFSHIRLGEEGEKERVDEEARGGEKKKKIRGPFKHN